MKYFLLLLLLPACNIELGCNTHVDHQRWCFRLDTFEIGIEHRIGECKTPSCVDWNKEQLDLLQKACDEEQRREHENR